MGIESKAFLLILILALGIPLNCGAEATATRQAPSDIRECGNQRYEDFYKRQHEAEQADRNREKYAEEIKEVRLQHDESLEMARREFIKTRVRTIEDPQLEKAAQEAERAWREKNETDRRRYVQAKDESEKSQCHSLKIPELKEYDLENY